VVGLVVAAIVVASGAGHLPPALGAVKGLVRRSDPIIVFRASDGGFWKAHLDQGRLVDAAPIDALAGREITDLALSPDATAIAYTTTGASGRSTYLFDLRTGATVPIVSPPAGTSFGPIWSSGGLRIAVSVSHGQRWDLALFDRFSGSLTRLQIPRKVGDCITPAWGEGRLAGYLYCLGEDRLRVLQLADGARVDEIFEKAIPAPPASPRRDRSGAAGGDAGL
jgi:hypothetical protein